MDPELLEELGLPDDATIEDVMAAIQALKQAAKEPDGDEGDDTSNSDDEGKPTDSDDEEGDDNGKPTDRATARRQARAALRGNRDDAILTMLDRLDKKIDRVGSRVDGGERESIMRANANKFTPKLERAARKWPLDILRDFVANAAPVHSKPEEEEEGPEAHGGSRNPRLRKESEELTAEEINVAKLMGTDLEELKAFKKNGLKLVKKKSA